MDVILKNVSVGNLNALRISVERCINFLEGGIDSLNTDLEHSPIDKDFLYSMLSDRKKELKEFKDILKQL